MDFGSAKNPPKTEGERERAAHHRNRKWEAKDFQGSVPRLLNINIVHSNIINNCSPKTELLLILNLQEYIAIKRVKSEWNPKGIPA